MNNITTKKRGPYRRYKKWCGIYGIELICNGEYSDPELRYKKHIFNSHEVEDAMYEIYLEKHPFVDVDDEQFPKWMYYNRCEVKSLMDDILYNKQ